MENQKEVLIDIETNLAAIPTTEAKPKKLSESYSSRISKMSDRVLLAETKRQGKQEVKRSHPHGVIYATVLAILMQGHIDGRPPYLR